MRIGQSALGGAVAARPAISIAHTTAGRYAATRPRPQAHGHLASNPKDERSRQRYRDRRCCGVSGPLPGSAPQPPWTRRDNHRRPAFAQKPQLSRPVGRTPWSARDPPVPLPAPCQRLMSASRQPAWSRCPRPGPRVRPTNPPVRRARARAQSGLAPGPPHPTGPRRRAPRLPVRRARARAQSGLAPAPHAPRLTGPRPRAPRLPARRAEAAAASEKSA